MPDSNFSSAKHLKFQCVRFFLPEFYTTRNFSHSENKINMGKWKKKSHLLNFYWNGMSWQNVSSFYPKNLTKGEKGRNHHQFLAGRLSVFPKEIGERSLVLDWVCDDWRAVSCFSPMLLSCWGFKGPPDSGRAWECGFSGGKTRSKNLWIISKLVNVITAAGVVLNRLVAHPR